MKMFYKVLRVGESYYHAACFTCTECHASLSKGGNDDAHDNVADDDDDDFGVDCDGGYDGDADEYENE